MKSEPLRYKTRDGQGNDIVKMVDIKEFPTEDIPCECGICHRSVSKSITAKKAVSANFTDWNWIGDRICEPCSRLLSLYKYSYIVEGDSIELLNVRQIRNALLRAHKTPNLMIITTSQKKHLFYKAAWNYSDDSFAVNLEEETIYTTRERMRALFYFVENMLALGASKQSIKERKLYKIIEKIGFEYAKPLYDYIHRELTESREIQIPLHCAQKPEENTKTEEEAICCIISTLKASNTQELRY